MMFGFAGVRLICLIGGCLAAFNPSLQAQQPREVAVTPLLSTTVTSTGQPIVMPRNEAELVVSIYEVGPHAALPEHLSILTPGLAMS
jgi:hypothetical protein